MTTEAEQIVKVLAEIVPDGGAALNPQALAHAQAIRGEVVPRLEANELTAQAWQTFQQSPQAQAAGLIPAVQLLLGADAALAARLDALLQAYQQAQSGKQETRTTTASGERSIAIGGDARDNEFNMGNRIDTGGGAYIGGKVNTGGGAFTGRNSYNIQGDGNVIGEHSSSTVIKQQGADVEALARAFAAFYTAIQRKPDLPPEDKEDLRAELEEVETELQQGEEAREGFIRRRLRNIERMAPDIYDVVLATFANPVAGLGMVAKKVAEKMKAEAE
jgi:hypothetical protein